MSSKRRLIGALTTVLAATALLASAGLAAITGTSGAVQQIPPPSSVAEGALQSDSRIVAFDERQCVTLASSVTVDVTPGGGGGTIPAGTNVSSQFLHFDPVSSNVTLSGSITVDGAILGAATTQGSLDASDPVLGAPGTTYQGANNNARGLEAGDSVSISGNQLTLTTTVTEMFHFDQVRVISQCPPPPPPPGEAFCEETVNPAGKNTPPAGSSTLPGPKGGVNDDGFYRVGTDTGTDVRLEDTDGNVFGVFPSGTRVKYTEANGAEPSVKKMGNDGDAVEYHIKGSGDLVVVSVASGDRTTCPVPPPPK